MPGFEGFGKMLVIMGLILLVAGGILWMGAHLGGLGRLPGDIYVKKGNFTFYFPLVSSIIISLVLTILLNFIFR